MKLFLWSALTAVALCVVVPTQAMLISQAPRSLKSGMKMMQSHLKTISKQATDTAKNEESAQLADELSEITEATKNFVPDSLDQLPPAEQALQKDLYERMMNDTAALGAELANAFRANDNVKAAELLQRLAKSKKDGHADFK